MGGLWRPARKSQLGVRYREFVPFLELCYLDINHCFKLMKLLVVSLRYPEESHYRGPVTIESFMWGRSINNYHLFAVHYYTMTPIVLTSAEVTEIKQQVMEFFK